MADDATERLLKEPSKGPRPRRLRAGARGRRPKNHRLCHTPRRRTRRGGAARLRGAAGRREQQLRDRGAVERCTGATRTRADRPGPVSVRLSGGARGRGPRRAQGGTDAARRQGRRHGGRARGAPLAHPRPRARRGASRRPAGEAEAPEACENRIRGGARYTRAPRPRRAAQTAEATEKTTPARPPHRHVEFLEEGARHPGLRGDE